MYISMNLLVLIVSHLCGAIMVFAALFAMMRWFDRKRPPPKVKRRYEDIYAELKGDIANIHMELKGDIANTRAELKDDIRLVRQNSEDAHKEINERLRALKDQAHVVDKGLSTLTARVDCIDDKIDGIQRQLEEA